MAVLPIAHVLHAAELHELADGKAFERGRAYQRQGRVSALTRDGKTVKATVSGSEPYEVRLWVTGDRIAYACSCPVGEEGSFCKHCVAVALTLQAELARASTNIGDEATLASDEEPAGAAARAERDIADEATVASAEEASTAREVTAPQPLPPAGGLSVFLAGSIDMGEAPPWQRDVVGALSEPGLSILNPRRPDWDASWSASIDDARFVEQVEWELAAMERADVIAMYFAPTSQAPITLLELGLFAESGKLIVCCPDGYFRKGNVDVVCRRYAVHQTHDLPALVRAVRARLKTIRRA